MPLVSDPLSGVAPDEQTALRLFESLSRLGTKKQTIRSAKLKQFLQAYKVSHRRVFVS